MNKITLGFSPCPNDTFIFDAMVHHKIDTEGLEFEYFMADVEELNTKAFKGIPDVCKVSYHAYLHLIDTYVLLNSGSALGDDVGPLFISKNDLSNYNLADISVGIPGKYTTANLLLSIAYPEINHKEELLFSDIEASLLKEELQAGVIIHENRFTYYKRGLKLIADLGKRWFELTQQPIPLGGIIIKRNLDKNIIKAVDRILKKSVEYAFANPDSPMEFIRNNAQEMEEEVMLKHINLYVNQYSIELGVKGRVAIETLFKIAFEKGLIAKFPQKELFL